MESVSLCLNLMIISLASFKDPYAFLLIFLEIIRSSFCIPSPNLIVSEPPQSSIVSLSLPLLKI